ncbi:MAG: phage minor head protein [Verrucomicrobiota bacterium]
MFLTTPVPHKEAAAAITDKTNITRRVFDRLLPELQEAAFTVSGVECFDSLQRIKEAIASVPQGGDWDSAKQQIEDELEPWLDNEAARQRRAELLLRLHGFRAYAATNFKLMEAHRGTFPYRQYIATNDTRVRDTHAALHGKVFPADSKFWENHTGPWEWGCRCEAVPLLPEEAAEMLAEDKIKRLPPEAWRVVPEAILDRVEQTGFIDVGPHEQGGIKKKQGVFDIRTPREKTGDAHAFEWRPGDIGLPISKIKQRYDAGTFKTWEKWAKRTYLPDGRNLWTALGSRVKRKSPVLPVSASKSQSPSPLPTPPPSLSVGIRPASTQPTEQVRARLAPTTKSGFVPSTTDTAMAIVAQVHSDGGLKQSPVLGEKMSDAWGRYDRITTQQRRAVDPFDYDSRIRLNPGSPHPLQTLVHEVGHKIDYEVIREIRDSLKNPPAIQIRADIVAALKATARAGDIAALGNDGYRFYLQKDVEWFARGYAQYIAQRSGHPALNAELEAQRVHKDARRLTVWDEADFASVMPLFDKLMVTLGWATTA